MTYPAVRMKSARLELRITEELLEQIDAARGDVSRTRWVERAIEAHLERSAPTPRPNAALAPKLPKIAPRHWSQ